MYEFVKKQKPRQGENMDGISCDDDDDDDDTA